MDIMGLILKAIGGEKLKQVSSVFADGHNITRQNGGGIGINSIFNSSPTLQAAFSQSGLSGILQNPMMSNVSSLVNSVQSSISTISSAVAPQSSGGNSGGPPQSAFPTFAPALSSALTTLNTYSRMTNLLTGNAAPDYTTDEFGIADTLDATSNGLATFSDLNAPIAPTTLPISTVQSFQTLLQNAKSQSVSDSNATSQLNLYMAPIVAAMAQSNQAFFNATQATTANTLLSEVFSYLTGLSSPQADFIESIMYPQFVAEVVAANQVQAATADANHADSTPESIDRAEYCRQKLNLFFENGVDENQQII